MKKPFRALQSGHSYVALFDFLGFKDFLRQFDAGDARERMGILRNLLKAPVDGYGRADGHAVLFSDTLILYSWDDKPASFEKTVIACARFLSLAIRFGFPVRGAIGHGTFLYDDDEDAMFLVGTAIVNAYEWERRQEWVGAIVTPECWSFAESTLTAENSVGRNLLCEYEVPVKNHMGERFQAIDWPKLVGPPEATQEVHEKIDAFLRTTAAKPDAHNKWVNTRRFWRHRFGAGGS